MPAFEGFLLAQGVFFSIFLTFLVCFALNFPHTLQMNPDGYELHFSLRPRTFILRGPFEIHDGRGVSGCGFFRRIGRCRGLLSIFASNGILTSNSVPSVFLDSGGWRNCIVFTPQNDSFISDYRRTFASQAALPFDAGNTTLQPATEMTPAP
eukprot:GEMP01080933.1.p1 GENE.GEMP01080933.1~~GEMP01080933.1.p1  ORF type:complete len:152 (+),score=17.86 GEMP01080933.1:244-699(+)